MGQKWYVVTVGKDIGVFDNWLEVAPLVKGVPGAVHQSFRSKDIAYKLFKQEEAKGNTRVVEISPSCERIPGAIQPSLLAQTEKKIYAMHISQTELSASHHGQGTPATPPSSSKAIFSTSLNIHNSPSYLPFKKKGSARRNMVASAAVVRSPSWLPAYPSDANGESSDSPLLSPLLVHDNANLSVNTTPGVLYPGDHFRLGSTHSIRGPGSGKTHISSALNLSNTDTSDDENPIILWRSTRKVITPPVRGDSLSSSTHGLFQAYNQQSLYDSRSDPRSPMGKGTISSLPPSSALFGRPSPYINPLVIDTN
ncbi:hypothetical protein BDQ17DRAFT_696513 [Cyathus striatus]|nr:hypothetical protein BDQ17DRAFT_696513 [Cyathus striatus]